jgi:ribokinase
VITVIGSINLDLIGNVERLPRPGETVSGSAFKTAPGGKGANQALAAPRAGAPVRMIGSVGKDSFAADALALLKSGGVDLTCVYESHASTGTALIMVDEEGENFIAVIPGANAAVQAGDFARTDFAKGHVMLLQHEIPITTVEAALDKAREAGVISVLNTAPARDDAAPLLAKADYVIANETEFDLYSKPLKLAGDRLQRMRDFAARTGRTIVVTLGGEGVVAAGPDGVVSVEAMKITPVDTVGAGDTFCGYFGAALLAGLPLEAALKRASTAASLACLKPGAQPAIPLAQDVDEALAEQVVR